MGKVTADREVPVRFDGSWQDKLHDVAIKTVGDDVRAPSRRSEVSSLARLGFRGAESCVTRLARAVPVARIAKAAPE